MNTTTLSILLATSFLVPAAMAQERSRPLKLSVAAAKPKIPAGELSKNVSVSIKGTLADGSPIDLTLTGCGTTMNGDFIIGATKVGENSIPNIGTLQYSIQEGDGTYTVSVSIGIRMAVPTATVGNGHTTIGFQEVAMTGKVRLVPEGPVEFFKSGEQSLTLTLSEP